MVGLRSDRELAWSRVRRGTRTGGGTRATGGPVKPNTNHRITRDIVSAAALPVRHEPGAEIRVFSGTSGSATTPTRNYAPVAMVEVRLEPHANVEQELPPGYNAFVVILEGGGTLRSSSTAVRADQVARLTPSDGASTVAFAGGDQGLRALLFAGLPQRSVRSGRLEERSRSSVACAERDGRPV
jgi:redox-sensitive bicupin YhaK (pirin superfamily)